MNAPVRVFGGVMLFVLGLATHAAFVNRAKFGGMAPAFCFIAGMLVLALVVLLATPTEEAPTDVR